MIDSDPSGDAGAPVPSAAAGAGGNAASRLDDLVAAVRGYRDAESSMRSRSRNSMHLGKTDMTALRLMIRAAQSGRPLSAAALARELSISTAATTVLLDRLEKSGHAERRRNASDGRSIEIWPTAVTDAEVRSTMGALHERMIAIASALPPEDSRIIHRFLGALGQALTELDFPVSDPSARNA